jgi:hypothetical protein
MRRARNYRRARLASQVLLAAFVFWRMPPQRVVSAKSGRGWWYYHLLMLMAVALAFMR